MTTGLSTDGAELVVSTGLLDALSERELAAVVAHVKNRDAAVMTLVELPLASARHLGMVLRSSGGAHFALLGVALASYAFRATGRALVASLSRARERAADRGSAAITGDPAALASALRTLDGELVEPPDEDLRHEEVVALSVVPPPREPIVATQSRERRRPVLWSVQKPVRRGIARGRRGVRRTFSTHPPTGARIERLRALERPNERG